MKIRFYIIFVLGCVSVISCKNNANLKDHNSQSIFSLDSTNSEKIDPNTCRLEIRLQFIDSDKVILKEAVYIQSKLAPWLGGTFNRVLAFKDRKITQMFCLPNGQNCDSSKIDTLSYLFLHKATRNTIWKSFNGKRNRCADLQLLDRFKYVNILKVEKNKLILIQKLIENETYINIYVFNPKSFNIEKVIYIRNNKYTSFHLHHGSVSAFFNKLNTG